MLTLCHFRKSFCGFEHKARAILKAAFGQLFKYCIGFKGNCALIIDFSEGIRYCLPVHREHKGRIVGVVFAVIIVNVQAGKPFAAERTNHIRGVIAHKPAMP